MSHLSRRGFIGSAGAVAAGSILLGESALAADRPFPATPNAAFKALLKGNERYRTGHWTRRDYSPVAERRAQTQRPFAAILACADSRISPPLIFDVERGNLFAAHVAGNSADEVTIGSLEYAVAVLRVPLIMVLGHSNCGAVKSAQKVAAGTTSFPPQQFGAIGALVDKIVPAIQALPAEERNNTNRCVASNARIQAQTLRTTGPILREAVVAGRLRIVSAVYDIGTGRVEQV